MKRLRKNKYLAFLLAVVLTVGFAVSAVWTGVGAEIYRTGDINGDGTVNTKDVVRLMKYLSAYGMDTVEVNEPALDTNGDGLVNAKDLTRLRRYLAGTAELAEIELPTETETETETETQPIIDPDTMMEIEDFLDMVKYSKYEPTGDKNPYYMGRWFEKEINGEAHMVTVTDGSLLYFMTDGASEIRVNFTNITPSIATPFFAYSIDGATPVRQQISSPRVQLPDAGMHTVRIIADGMTEGNGTPKWAYEEGFALKNITIDKGEMYGIKPTEKVIFFYGDSITEGINALSSAADSTSNSATRAYAWFAAQNLNAVGYVIGHGGSGLTRTGSFNTMLNAIDKLSANRNLADHPNADITPDLIVINHGANDGLGGTGNSEFETALRATLARVQAKYPGVTVIYVMPFMESWQENVRGYGPIVDRVAGEFNDIHVVHTSTWGSREGIGRGLDLTTDSLHPNARAAELIGAKVASEIKAIVGENFFK